MKKIAAGLLGLLLFGFVFFVFMVGFIRLFWWR
jgi:hypothetical protein